ncbi:YdbH domain-containing protein [Isoalcanivorax beigongshangi]|uniref:YdbH domain-containing protein n=1 Tax=Isoalcanivorax beigongshangi TaxID=3238810 RepID=A0ABV4AL20_9GAMM
MRVRKLLLWLGLVVLALMLLLIALWYGLRPLAGHYGVNWQSHNWQQGALVLRQLRWQDDDCERVQLDALVLVPGWPLRVLADGVKLPACPAAPATDEPFTLPQLPWMPPLEARVSGLVVADQQLDLRLSHRQRQWWLVARALTWPQALLSATLDQEGRWQVAGRWPLAALSDQVVGGLRVHGSGDQYSPRPQGRLELTLDEVGVVDRPERADLAATLTLSEAGWQAALQSSGPVRGAPELLIRLEPWQLQGDWSGTIAHADGALTVEAEAGRAALHLDSDGLDQGNGRLAFSSEWLSGEVPFSWQQGQLTVPAHELAGSDGLRVRWPELTVPLATSGEAAVSLALDYQELAAQVVGSRVSWSLPDWRWQGRVRLSGTVADAKLDGGWNGHWDAAGPGGEPLRLALQHPQGQLALDVPVSPAVLDQQRVEGSVRGRAEDIPLSGRWSASWAGAQPHGDVTLTAQLPEFSHGGQLTLTSRWQLDTEAMALTLPAGATLQLDSSVWQELLLRPVTVTSVGPLQLDEHGARGRLALAAEGLVAARHRVPALAGELDLKGVAAALTLRVPDWDTRLSADAAPHGGGWAGRLTLESPLSPAQSQSLPLTLADGQVSASGRWQWQDDLSLEASLRLRDAVLDWGGVRAEGVAGEWALSMLPGQRVRAHSVGPMTVAKADVGFPITEIAATLDTDLEQWRLTDIRAELLGGELLAPALSWPGSAYQTVVVTRIELPQLAALQSEPVVTLTGRVGGYLPLRLGADSVAIRAGKLANETPLGLSLLSSDALTAMKASNTAVSLALDSLSVLEIGTFQAQLDMADDGWLSAAVNLAGVNPSQGGLAVAFNYTHQENLRVLLRSLRIADELSQQVMESLP